MTTPMFRTRPIPERRAPWAGIVLSLAAVATLSPVAAQPPCDPLPPPSGTTVEVFPAQADSLQDIVAGAATGTTILLHDGNYAMNQGDGVSRLVFATPGVTLRSFSGNRSAVALDGDYLTDELISIYASNVTIADLTVREAFNHPIHVSGNPTPITGVLIHNVRVVDPGQQGIKINPVGEGWTDYGTIECCAIELTDAGRPFIRDNCYTGGVDGHKSWGWVIRRNFISGFWCPIGISEHAVHFWTASRDTVVEENVILDCARGVGFGLGSTGAGRTYPDNPYPGAGYLGHLDGVIRNNFIAAADPDLFASEYGFDAGIALEQAREPWVAHNTVASTAAPFSSIEWRFGNTVTEIANNLVTHNLRPRDGAQANLQGNLSEVATDWFVSTATADLHLTALASAAVDAGVSLAAGIADSDIDLQPRGLLPDVGSDEVLTSIFADGFESGDTSAWSGGAP